MVGAAPLTLRTMHGRLSLSAQVAGAPAGAGRVELRAAYHGGPQGARGGIQPPGSRRGIGGSPSPGIDPPAPLRACEASANTHVAPARRGGYGPYRQNRRPTCLAASALRTPQHRVTVASWAHPWLPLVHHVDGDRYECRSRSHVSRACLSHPLH